MLNQLKETFLSNTDYQTLDAKNIIIKNNAEVLEDFIKGLRKRKSKVYVSIMEDAIIGFEGVITLSSLLLQINLYCRKYKSLRLLEQLKADDLTKAILSFYDGSYSAMRDYSIFIKSVFNLVK